MGVHAYKVWNGAAPLGSLLTKVTTGSGAVKTMLQLATPSTRMATIVGWGYTLDAVPASAGEIELVETDVAATGLTAHVAANIMQQMPGVPNSLLTLGTGATGYATGVAPTENTPTVTRLFDNAEVPPTAGATDLQYDWVFPYDKRPVVNISKFLRIRVNFGAAVNMSCYVDFEE